MEYLGRPPPKPEEIFVVPPSLLLAAGTVAAKLSGVESSWGLMGDLAENLQGVHVRPKDVQIVTDAEGLKEIVSRLAEYHLPEPTSLEGRLDREAEIDDKKFPVFTRSRSARGTISGADVRVHGDYQMKVGDWEWGDPVIFEPLMVNLAGVEVPVMPLRIASEIYLTLGWVDRVQEISEAVGRAHHALHEQTAGEPVY